MADRLWKSEAGLSNIFISLDKNKTSKIELAAQTLLLAEQFGYIDQVEIPSEEGNNLYLKLFSSSDWVNSKEIQNDIFTFIKENKVEKMHYQFGTLLHDVDEQRIISDVISFSFYLESNEEDWGMYFNINNDIFAPYRWESNPQAEDLAQKNAPLLKDFLEKTLSTFPVNSFEWEEDYSNIQKYLKRI